MMLIAGEELSGGGGGMTTSSSSLAVAVEEENSEENLIKEIEKRTNKWTEREFEIVKESKIIRNFLEINSNQLTYTGLISLSTELKPSSLSALFRNSHLSVIYRRPSSQASSSSPFTSSTSTSTLTTTVTQGPELFTLVTDLGLVSQYPNIVWESLEDIDGSGTRFWDGALRESRIVESNSNSNSNSNRNRRRQSDLREVVELSQEARENNE